MELLVEFSYCCKIILIKWNRCHHALFSTVKTIWEKSTFNSEKQEWKLLNCGFFFKIQVQSFLRLLHAALKKYRR